ncbi:MATE family efflux transporter [Oscillospiraceae bacterium OttesenSCG-928-G22]|nr:MATE family efflux transporter [Oscillospiraceae bacterium OttesenSCG-928-G22]
MSKIKVPAPGIRREFARYAIPACVGMVVSSLYNIVDGVFVGRGVGEVALGAINIVYPYVMLQIAITMLVAIGGANHFSANRGRGKNEAANNIFLQSIYLLVGLGVVINALALAFAPGICRLLGADEALLPYARDYLWWIALFGVVYLPGLGLSIFVRNDNAPRRELVGTLVGTVVNIVLDYLFIMRFGMGIAGAAIATGIGQTVSVLIFLSHFLQTDRVLRFRKVRWNGADLKKILLSGAPSFLVEFSQSAVAFSFNLVLMARVGAVGVSYYSIVMYICSMFNMVLIGLTQGAQPIMSFHYGGGHTASVKAIHHLAIRTALTLTAVIYAAVFFFGGNLAAVFVPESAELAGMAARMMKYYFLAFFPVGVTLLNILFFQVTERNRRSVALSFLRCIGGIQLFLLLLPPLLGVVGIYLSFLCGELCHCLFSLVLLKNVPLESGKESAALPAAVAEGRG